MFPLLRKTSFGVTRHALWPLLGASMVAFLFPEWQGYALGLLVLLVLIAWIAGGRYNLPVSLLGTVALLALTGWISLRVTPDVATTRWHVGRWWAGIALVYGVVAWSATRRQWDRLEILSALLGMGLMVVGALVVQWPRGKLPFVPQTLYATLPVPAQGIVNANMLAGALTMLLLFPWASALWATGRWYWAKRLLYGVVTVLMVAELLLTQSRGAILAAGLALGVLLVARWPRLVFVWWPIALVVGWMIAKGGLDTFLQSPVTENAVSGLPSRVELWKRALLMVRDFPLTGVGAGLFERAMWVLYPPTQIRPVLQAGLHAHNVWLQVAVDLGLPGLSAFMALIGISLVQAIRALRSTKAYTPLVWGGLGALLSISLHGLVDAPWMVGRAAFALWWTLAVLLSATQKT